ncbi:MAG: hypothetical protein QOG87_3688 [Actinomycetota bacterium]|jgi:hypothetical protein
MRVRLVVVALAAFITTSVGGLLLPAQAEEPIPGVPPGVIPPGVIPPGAIPPGLIPGIPPGTLPSPLVPAIDGVGGAAASPGSASASVVELPGVLIVGKSESSKTGAKVTVLSVGGTDLLVKNGSDAGPSYSGPLAPVGDQVDAANKALCPAGPGKASANGCVVVLYSDAKTNQAAGTSRTNSAQFRAFSVTTPDGAQSLTLGSTSASTTRTPLFGTTRCTDIATSFLVSGTGTAAALILVNPGGPAAGIKFSVFKVC